MERTHTLKITVQHGGDNGVEACYNSDQTVSGTLDLAEWRLELIDLFKSELPQNWSGKSSKHIGIQLFHALFNEEIASFFASCLKEAENDKDSILYLQLLVDDPVIAQFPWVSMYYPRNKMDRESGRFLSKHKNIELDIPSPSGREKAEDIVTKEAVLRVEIRSTPVRSPGHGRGTRGTPVESVAQGGQKQVKVKESAVGESSGETGTLQAATFSKAATEPLLQEPSAYSSSPINPNYRTPPVLVRNQGIVEKSRGPGSVDTTEANKRDIIFFSYSQKDERWLDDIIEILQPIVRSKKLLFWSNKEIKPGEVAREKIKESLKRTKVAVLLVTKSFLASDLILNDELIPQLEAEKEGVKIFWIKVGQCDVENTEITKYKPANDPATPLYRFKKGPNLDDELVKISKKLQIAIEEQRN